MSLSDRAEFGKVRGFLWPIHRYELKKLLPMLGIFFLISLNYNILRSLKDALVVTAKSSGAEVIPFIKVWAMLPTAFIMTWLFTSLSNRMNREKVFYVMICLFLGFFALFAYFIYPNQDLLHPHAMADRAQQVLPIGLKGLVAMVRYWSFTCFYVFAELWGSMILFLVFWGFANAVTSVHEAKRFYALFGIGANSAGAIAGRLSIELGEFSSHNPLFLGTSPFHQSLLLLVSIVLISGVIAIFLFRWLNSSVLSDPRFYDPSTVKTKKKFKDKLSFWESVSYLRKSPYLMRIAVIVIAYNAVINLTEVLWKHEVHAAYPDGNDYVIYMNRVTELIGYVATLTALVVSGNIIRRCGWSVAAMITPMILLVTSIGFFSCFFIKEAGPYWLLALLGSAPQLMVVFFGSAQNILSRASKYTVYDATKELAFIPLSDECKLKGKAVIDGVGSRLGKSGGAVVHQVLLMFCGSIVASAPFVAMVLFVVVFIWIGSVRGLGADFVALTESDEKIDLPSETPPSATAPVPAI